MAEHAPTSNGDESPRFYTLEEVAELVQRAGLPVALRTLRDHCTSGVLAAEKHRRTWRVAPGAVAAYIELLRSPAGGAALAARPQRPQGGGESPRALAMGTTDDLASLVERAISTPPSAPPCDGPWSTRHANGRLAAQGEYRDGAQDGRWTYWDDAGRKLEEGAYKDGLPHGRWTVYHEDGSVWKEADFDAGRLVGGWFIHPPS